MSDKSDAGFVAAGRAIAPLVNENVRLRTLNDELVEALAGAQDALCDLLCPIHTTDTDFRHTPACAERHNLLSRARAKEDT